MRLRHKAKLASRSPEYPLCYVAALGVELYTRNFFTVVTRQSHAAVDRDTAELCRLLTLSCAEEPRLLVGGTPPPSMLPLPPRLPFHRRHFRRMTSPA